MILYHRILHRKTWRENSIMISYTAEVNWKYWLEWDLNWHLWDSSLLLYLLNYYANRGWRWVFSEDGSAIQLCSITGSTMHNFILKPISWKEPALEFCMFALLIYIKAIFQYFFNSELLGACPYWDPLNVLFSTGNIPVACKLWCFPS